MSKRSKANPQAPAPRRAKSAPKTRQEPVLVGTANAAPRPAKATKSAKKDSRQDSLDFSGSGSFQLPPARLLNAPGKALSGPSKQALQERAEALENVLSDFSVNGSIADVRYGPVVTRYDLNPAPGTKSQRVISLADDIARSMSAISVRVAVVPGQNVIGIELPNDDRQTVMLRDILDDQSWAQDQANLPMALGKDIAGAPVIVDLAKMPHLLVAGTTGSGKSVGINAMILSMLYRHTPDTCRMIMIDPKMLELSVYDGIPHLLSPVVTDPSKAVTALKWAVREMENRYRNMAKMGVRNITGYNERLAEARAKGEVLTRRVQTGFDPETGKPVHEEEVLDLAPLPFIVVIIDE
ncbi:MAG: DNA translocase FtsK, partial [Pseudomonadota bacterium]|nr:DNA translocase FtsK [Pseudomonadota bacterium]